jgi:hypothetical protein
MKKLLVFVGLLALTSCGKDKDREAYDAKMKDQIAQEKQRDDSATAAMTPDQLMKKQVLAMGKGYNMDARYLSDDTIEFTAILDRGEDPTRNKINNVREYFKKSIDFVSAAFIGDKKIKVIRTQGAVKLLSVEPKPSVAIQHDWQRKAFEKASDKLKTDPLRPLIATMVKNPYMHNYYTQNATVTNYLLSDFFTYSDLSK